MQDTEQVHSAYKNRRVAKLLLQKMWHYDRRIFFFLGLEIVFGVIAGAAVIYLPALVIGVLNSTADADDVIATVICAFAFYGVIRSFLVYLESRNRAQYIDYREACFWRVELAASISCDYEVYEKESTRTLAQKANRGMNGNQWGVEGFFHDLKPLLTALIGLLVYALTISFVSPLIILLLLVLSALSYLFYFLMYKRSAEIKDHIAKESVHSWYFEELAYNVSLGKDIRLYQSHPLLKRLFTSLNANMRRLENKRRDCILIYEIVVEILSCIRDAVCYGYLIYLMSHSMLSVAAFVFYLGIISGFSAYFTQITTGIVRINENLGMAAFFFDYTDLLKPTGGKDKIKGDTLDIVLEHVSYTYPGSERPVIEDFCLHLSPGEKLALVGENGAGKTTLVKLLAGLYHPNKGRILVNGTDLALYDHADYCRHIGALFQDTKFFSFTIGENVSCLYEGTYDDAAVLSAIEHAGLKEKIDALPKGIHTYLGKDISDDGILLSGGETQKLMLARALFKEPALLILDEPTAALDALSEQELYLQYNGYLKNKSALFISHRLASTRFCDRIILMKDGQIAEEGSHESLMRKKGTYYKMFEAQSKYYREEGGFDEDLL